VKAAFLLAIGALGVEVVLLSISLATSPAASLSVFGLFSETLGNEEIKNKIERKFGKFSPLQSAGIFSVSVLSNRLSLLLSDKGDFAELFC
jgi:hypothetical protein